MPGTAAIIPFKGGFRHRNFTLKPFVTNECGPREYLRITFASHQNKNSL
jgi:hypothetical protein